MEVKKCHNLPSASWRLRKVNGVAPILKALEPGKSQSNGRRSVSQLSQTKRQFYRPLTFYSIQTLTSLGDGHPIKESNLFYQLKC